MSAEAVLAGVLVAGFLAENAASLAWEYRQNPKMASAQPAIMRSVIWLLSPVHKTIEVSISGYIL